MAPECPGCGDCSCSHGRLVRVSCPCSQIPILPGVAPQEGWLSPPPPLGRVKGTGHDGGLFASVSGLGGGRVKRDSLGLSVYSFVGPLSSCQPSQWDNCPLYNNLPTFRVAAFTVPILLWTSITTGLCLQSLMISGYKQYARQQRHLLYFLIL